jgi:hypothetical protein
MTRPRAGVLAMSAVLAGGAMLADVRATAPLTDVKVTPVVATDGRVLVSFDAPASFTEEARRILKSGLVLTLTYAVDLRRPSIWIDPTLCSMTVAASARFDSLTRTYEVSKYRNGQAVRSDKVDQEAQVRDWLTRFESVLLEPVAPLVPNGDYYVRVRLRADPRGSFSLWQLWPWRGDDASGRADFIFIR